MIGIIMNQYLFCFDFIEIIKNNKKFRI